MTLRAKDIAEMLGVSASTLSIVLNNRPGVSDKTRTQILDKIKELHCEYLLKGPILAQTPPKKETVGFVVYKRFGDIITESPFFNYTLEGITAALKAQNYDLKFVYLDRELSRKEQEALLLESNCRGFLVYAVEMYEDDLEIFIHTPVPFVLLDNSFQTRDVDCVAINNSQGIYKAMRYLYEMGHRDIGYIKSRVSITSFKERFREYLRQQEEMGLIFHPDHVLEAGYSEPAVNAAMDHYLEHHSLPTAFLADNDLLACYAMQALKRHGFSIPEDVSIIGFDDRPICRLVDPPLTTVAVPLSLFGPSAIELLLTKIENPRSQSLKVDIGTSLLPRASVAKILPPAGKKQPLAGE
ncbi:LacI family DNA-binding transcriptional regulator [Hominifimenecus sp. rT4P-3]|uniref:LacI family DNA-binding transcriptional regulator n=1 Tax=Hominifimenecus sp. rT4P-3 TaxID=3242979 RepID=UPI003DA5AAD1